jgi:hypothetical protein
MISEKLKLHLRNYVKITRTVAKGVDETSSGYILNYSDDFVLMQEAGDFTLHAYIVLPVNQLKKIRHNKYDKCFKKIMIAEGEADKVGINYKIDLSSWQTILNSIKDIPLNVIVECEDPDIDTFTIGSILKITSKKTYIEHFDATGLIDEDPVKIDFDDITKLQFDARYINIFSKYLRRKKVKKA